MMRPFLFLALMATLVLASGCIRTRLHIESQPSQADVFVNEQPRGRTPIDIPIRWYWYYDIKVEKDGYKPLHAIEKIRTPFWAIFPLDLLAEAIPYPIGDTRYRHYPLEVLSDQ